RRRSFQGSRGHEGQGGEEGHPDLPPGHRALADRDDEHEFGHQSHPRDEGRERSEEDSHPVDRGRSMSNLRLSGKYSGRVGKGEGFGERLPEWHRDAACAEVTVKDRSMGAAWLDLEHPKKE